MVTRQIQAGISHRSSPAAQLFDTLQRYFFLDICIWLKYFSMWIYICAGQSSVLF